VTSTFLTPEDLRVLTGKAQKAKQAEQLRRIGVPFFLNAAGIPVVTRAAVEGGGEKTARKPWTPKVLVRFTDGP